MSEPREGRDSVRSPADGEETDGEAMGDTPGEHHAVEGDDEFRFGTPEPRKTLSALELRSRKWIRVGAVLIGIGFLIAFCCAILFNLGPDSFEFTYWVGNIHRGGLLVMLVGLLTALAGYRMVWMRDRATSIKESVSSMTNYRTDSMASDKQMSAPVAVAALNSDVAGTSAQAPTFRAVTSDSSLPERALPALPVTIIAIVTVAAPLILLALASSVMGLSLAWLGVYVSLLLIVVPVVNLTVAVYGRDWLRTFALGAMVPCVFSPIIGTMFLMQVLRWRGFRLDTEFIILGTVLMAGYFLAGFVAQLSRYLLIVLGWSRK